MPLTYYFSSPYRIPIVDSRASMYGFTGTPSVMFDGVTSSIGGLPSGSMFSYYNPTYLTRSGTPSPVVLESSYTIAGDQVTVTSTVTVDMSMPGGTNQIIWLVALADEHSHTNMVMAALPTATVSATGIGQQTTFERTFTLNAAWPEDELRIVALVQNLSSEEVLQAGLAAPDYRANIVVNCEPDGVGAAWTLTGPYGVLAEGSGDIDLNSFYSGEFTLQWQDVPYWTEPALMSETQTVGDGGQLVFTGTYSDGPFAAPAAAPGDPGSASRGVSLVDFDGDGDLDLHLLNQGSTDQLLSNSGGALTESGSGAILDAGQAMSSTWADVNGDGHLDVYIGRNGQANMLLAGDGMGGFTPVNAIGADDAGQAHSVAFVDYDVDGILDLYVVNSGGANAMLKGAGELMPGLMLYSAQQNGANNSGNGRGMAWADLDFDGRLDLYVVNAFGGNVLLKNEPFGFSDITSTSGVGDTGNGTGAAFGDFDNDGDWDLYVANDGAPDRLYRANGSGGFSSVLGDLVTDRGGAQGVIFADLDNDSHLDLYVPRDDDTDLMLIGDGTGQFVRAPIGWAEAGVGSRSVACGDMDGDGDLDLFLVRDGAADVMFLNGMAPQNNWFAVRLHGQAGNPTAIGALVEISAGGVNQMRQVTGSSGYLVMNGGPAHFGLGAVDAVDMLTITWPDGTVQTAGGLPANGVLDVTYGQDIVSAVGDEVPAAGNRLAAARPNPFNPSTTIEYALARTGSVRLEIFSVDGRRIATLVDGVQEAGPHAATWHGRDSAGRAVASGAYMYRLTAPDGEVLSGRMALVK